MEVTTYGDLGLEILDKYDIELVVRIQLAHWDPVNAVRNRFP